MNNKNEIDGLVLNPLLTPEQAANHLNVSVRTLAQWRSIGFPNIPYAKVGGRCVRYNLLDIKAYLVRHTQGSEGGESW